MKTYRQKSRASQQGVPAPATTVQTKGPDEEKIKKILERTGYTLDVTTGKTKTKFCWPRILLNRYCRRSKKIWWSTAELGR